MNKVEINYCEKRTIIVTAFFGGESPTGYSITNLGKIESRSIANAMFIPPVSPAIKKIKGILTVNERMNICVSQRYSNSELLA